MKSIAKFVANDALLPTQTQQKFKKQGKHIFNENDVNTQTIIIIDI